MRLPADPATDVPRLARVASGAPLLTASASEASLSRGSFSRSLSARASTPLCVSSEANLPSTASTRAVSEPVVGRTLRSALEQMRQQTAQAPGRGRVADHDSHNSRSSQPAVSGSSTPINRDSGQDRDDGNMAQRESLDGYVLQVSLLDCHMVDIPTGNTSAVRSLRIDGRGASSRIRSVCRLFWR